MAIGDGVTLTFWGRSYDELKGTYLEKFSFRQVSTNFLR